MKKMAGFTLIEVMVAISIFAMLGFGCYKVINGLVLARDSVSSKSEDLRRLSRAMRIINEDFSSISSRVVTDESGEKIEIFKGNDGQYVVEFTRSGVRNPLMKKRANTARIAYQFQAEINKNTDVTGEVTDGDELIGDGKRGYLVRYVWPVLDRGSDDTPPMEILLVDIKGFELEYFNEKRQWDVEWSSSESESQQANSSGSIPYAIKVTIDSARYGEIGRVFSLRKLPAI